MIADQSMLSGSGNTTLILPDSLVMSAC